MAGGTSQALGRRRVARAVLKGKRNGGRNATFTNVHGDALCFVVKTWARHSTTDALLNNVWRLAAVGGWWQLVAVGDGRLAVGGGGRWAAVGGPWWLSLGGVLHTHTK